jgi:hypothetical protein
MSAQHFAPFWIFFLPVFEPLKPHNHSNTAIVYVTTHFRNCIPQQLSCTDISYPSDDCTTEQRAADKQKNKPSDWLPINTVRLRSLQHFIKQTYDYKGQFLTAYFQRCIGLPNVEIILFQLWIPRNVILH